MVMSRSEAQIKTFSAIVGLVGTNHHPAQSDTRGQDSNSTYQYHHDLLGFELHQYITRLFALNLGRSILINKVSLTGV